MPQYRSLAHLRFNSNLLDFLGVLGVLGGSINVLYFLASWRLGGSNYWLAFLGVLGALGGSIIVLFFLASWRLGG